MRFFTGLIFGLVLVAVAAGLFLWTGLFNPAAAVPTSKMEEGLSRYALNRSVARRAPKSASPIRSSPEALRTGLSHYRENCLGCHGAPGVDPAEFGQGLNPPAPDLTLPRVQKRPDGELYWITANGIRMTGMPAFSPTHEEEEIWKIVAFLRHLEELTPEEEKELAAKAEASDHHHEPETAGKPEHVDPPGSKPHKH
jgi:mono/diheme cytochrome c family protein